MRIASALLIGLLSGSLAFLPRTVLAEELPPPPPDPNAPPPEYQPPAQPPPPAYPQQQYPQQQYPQQQPPPYQPPPSPGDGYQPYPQQPPPGYYPQQPYQQPGYSPYQQPGYSPYGPRPVYLTPRPPQTPRPGTAQIVIGAIFLPVGVSLLVGSAFVWNYACDRSVYGCFSSVNGIYAAYGGVFMDIFGAAFTVMGLIFLPTGIVKQARYNKWKKSQGMTLLETEKLRLSSYVTGGVQSGTLGLRLDF